jgi:hypothetical protein
MLVCVGFEFLMAVSTNVANFWVVPIIIDLMMKAAGASETLVKFYQTTRHYSPKESHFNTCTSSVFACCARSCLYLATVSQCTV